MDVDLLLRCGGPDLTCLACQVPMNPDGVWSGLVGLDWLLELGGQSVGLAVGLARASLVRSARPHPPSCPTRFAFGASLTGWCPLPVGHCHPPPLLCVVHAHLCMKESWICADWSVVYFICPCILSPRVSGVWCLVSPGTCTE